ncbi:aldehyde dehydrogenase family protein [Mycoplasmopsis glycophila]|uniref:Aldehyde dehydrogenase n=1 Tax=Mycoplasmopsis glycophila TaxID=171285 RepID=A0A449AUW6_9BACT|nr:aldehyde dehydrogenase family protein [Mycoplasmopsis glycophila]VEU70301.1 NAD-dependent aldehyde dehydrogenase domain-containing protein [Mycoplasmopsis glycophila]
MKNILNYEHKIKLLKRMKKVIFDNLKTISKALSKDLAKQHYEVMLTEIIPTIKEINFFLKKIKKDSFYSYQKFSLNKRIGYIYNPRGNVLLMNAWNYPFQLLFVPLVGSIAAGNITTIKLHPYSKELNKVIKSLIKAIDPDSSFIKIDHFESIGETFEQNEYDFVFFTGNNKTAEFILSKIDISKTEYCFELGGKSPFIVTEHANIKNASKMFCYGKLLNKGQTCIAPDYIFIHQKVYASFIKEVDKIIRKFKEEEFTNIVLSEIIPEPRKNKITDYLKNRNAKTDSPLILFQEQNLDDYIYSEEIFAPVSPLFVFKNQTQFDKLYAKNPFPLTMYIFSKNKKEIEYYTNFIAGNYMINNTISIFEDNKLSFGGHKLSGIGRYRGMASIELFSYKSSLIKKPKLDLLFSVKNRPYTSFKKKIISLYLKFLKIAK